MRSVLVVDETAERSISLATDLRAIGYSVRSTIERDPVDAIVVVIDDTLPEGLPQCARSEAARETPVIVVANDADAELRLRIAIEGAVRCVTGRRDADFVVRALDTVLATGAPSLAEQLRQARIDALEGLARADSQSARTSDDARCRVHLTRLEHGPVRTLPAPAAGSPFANCSSKQLELLRAIAREGSVTKAAGALGTSRSSVYASLRRIAHRLQLRDSHELLRLVNSGALPAAP